MSLIQINRKGSKSNMVTYCWNKVSFDMISVCYMEIRVSPIIRVLSFGTCPQVCNKKNCHDTSIFEMFVNKVRPRWTLSVITKLTTAYLWRSTFDRQACPCSLSRWASTSTPWVKKQDTKLLPITSPNVNRFSKCCHW